MWLYAAIESIFCWSVMIIKIFELIRKIYYLYIERDSVKYARSIGVKVGKGCRLIATDFGSEPYLITIGDHVSITNSSFITHDGGVWVFRNEFPEIDIVKPITIKNYVFIGYGCIILAGVTIGNNVVIGAGSVVTKDIPDNIVAAGVPARVIKSIQSYKSKAINNSHSTKNFSSIRKKLFYKNMYKFTK